MRVTQRQGLYAGVAILSAAGIVLQIALTRLYSALLGHHLAFLAISLSLFGIGLGGVLLYVVPAIARPPHLLARLALFSGLAGLGSVVAVVLLLHTRPIETIDPAVLGRLAGTYIVTSLPFVFIGIVVAAALRHAAAEVSRLYLVDLVGAAVGGAGSILALRSGGPRACLVVCVLCSLAALGFALGARQAEGPYGPQRPARMPVIATFVLGGAVLLVSDLRVPWLVLGELRWVDMKQVEFQQWNEMALITVDKPKDGMAWMRMDASAATAILAPDKTPPLHPDEMAYVLHRDQGPVCVIGAGGGRDIRAALKAGQKDVFAAEINPTIVNHVMRGKYREFSGGLFEKPEVHVSVADGRSFVRRSPVAFRNIVISLVDTWAAASVGALALSENSLYTVEAFRDFIEHLTPEGTLLVNRWDNEFPRLLALGAAALRETGAAEPKDHLFACGHERSTSLLVKRTPLTPEEIASLRAHCKTNRFYEVFAPDAPGSDLRRRLATLPDARQAWPGSPADLAPPTDDRPFFFYTVPARRLFSVLGDPRERQSQHGLLTLVGLLVTSAVIAVLFLLGPLLVRRVAILRAPDRGQRLRSLFFFLGLGAGFVYVEVALVQYFVMYLGHPIYALSTVLVALLLSTGLGSLLTARIGVERAQRAARARAIVLAVLLVVYALFLGRVLGFAVSLPFGLRLALTLGLLAPLGLLLGSQTPLGVRLIDARASDLLPWCWGLNGVASVMATAVGTLVAMHAGFRWLLVAGAATYLASALAAPAKPEAETKPEAEAEAKEDVSQA